MSVKDCTFTDCTVHGEGGDGGGGVFAVKTTDGCEFVRCHADGCGGGWRNNEYLVDVAVRNCIFTDCSAALYGGGVSAFGRSFGSDNSRIENCLFTGCSAEENGGGGIDNAYLVDNCEFQNCRAAEGGGVYNTEKIIRCRIESCSATGNGGGVCVAAELRASLLLKNSSGKTGGGSWGAASYSCTYAGNTAKGGDPALKLDSGTPIPRNCIFYNNAYNCDGSHADNCATATTGDFCDEEHDDYHLSLDLLWQRGRERRCDLQRGAGLAHGRQFDVCRQPRGRRLFRRNPHRSGRRGRGAGWRGLCAPAR